jgi:hypothetical protein
MQGKIFGNRKEEVTGSWRKLHNESLRNLKSSLNIMTKSRSVRCVGHVEM